MQYKVYDSLSPGSTEVLHGLKGQTHLDSGYIFAPYIPLQVTPLITRAYKNIKLAGLKIEKRKSVKTKYDKKAINTNFYATVSVKDPDNE